MTILRTRGPWHRICWRSVKQRFAGAGCLYTLVLSLLIWWLLALILPPFALWFPVASLTFEYLG